MSCLSKQLNPYYDYYLGLIARNPKEKKEVAVELELGILLIRTLLPLSHITRPPQIRARASFCVHCTHLGNRDSPIFVHIDFCNKLQIRNVLATNLMIHYTCILRNSVNSILASSFNLGPGMIHHSFVCRLPPSSFFLIKIVYSISLLLLQ